MCKIDQNNKESMDCRHKWRIIFRGDRIYLRDDIDNREILITDFVDYLKRFSIWPGYNRVPNEYYQAWKILVLGTSEYDDDAIRIIKYANDKFEEVNNEGN